MKTFKSYKCSRRDEFEKRERMEMHDIDVVFANKEIAAEFLCEQEKLNVYLEQDGRLGYSFGGEKYCVAETETFVIENREDIVKCRQALKARAPMVEARVKQKKALTEIIGGLKRLAVQEKRKTEELKKMYKEGVFVIPKIDGNAVRIEDKDGTHIKYGFDTEHGFYSEADIGVGDNSVTVSYETYLSWTEMETSGNVKRAWSEPVSNLEIFKDKKAMHYVLCALKLLDPEEKLVGKGGTGAKGLAGEGKKKDLKGVQGVGDE